MEEKAADELRAKARRHIWRTIGGRRACVEGAICPAGAAALNPWDIFGCEASGRAGCEFLDLDDVALNRVTLWRAAYTQSMTGADSSEIAYDLGDGFWYVFTLPDESEEGSPSLSLIAPCDQADAVFAQERLDWIRTGEALSSGEYPGEIGGIDLTAPATFRELAGTVFGGVLPEPQREDNSSALLDTVLDLAGKKEGEALDAEDEEAIRTYWNAAVGENLAEVVPAPPGLAELSISSAAFEGWLATAQPAWRDTHERLGSRTANALRLICQYLAVAART